MLPPEIGQLTTLENLDLSETQLSELPPEIGQLTALQSLNLGNNRLSELPPEIGRLTALQNLDLRQNELRELPPEIGQLTALQNLYLNGNRLSTLPSEIWLLTALQRLRLSANQLEVLSPEIGRLTSLRDLYLNRNRLKVLPSQIGRLTTLQTLDLSANQLTALPPEIRRLRKLQLLDLSENQLRTLPSDIADLQAIEILELGDNQLTALPPEIGHLTKLRFLNFPRNPLPEPYDGLLKLALPDATKTALGYLRGVTTPPLPLEGIPSPVDFIVSRSRPIRVRPSDDVQPLLNTPTDRHDHGPRLSLCRTTAATLLKMLDQQRFNVRERSYRQVLSEYIKYLPTTTRTRNLLFADQEARIIRDLFAEDADALPPEFAARLKALLQAHMALRAFYPGLQRFYDDVRFGRNAPLPIDAVEEITSIVREVAEVFDASVGQALADATPPLPAFTEAIHSEEAPVTIRPPPDMLGTLSTEKAQRYLRAGIINRLYSAFLKGEALNKNSEAWVKMGGRLIPHIRPILEWLSTFASGPPSS